MLIRPWEIQLLGALVVRRAGQQIAHFPTEKTGLLLAYLAAYPRRVHTREMLVELFWPASEPQAGRVSLRQALATLRRLLEPPDVRAGTVVLCDRIQIQLHTEAICTDLAAWDRLREQAVRTHSISKRRQILEAAAEGYGGEFLPGTYAEWALDERRIRQEQYLELLLCLIDMQTQAGNLTGATATSQLLLRTDPLQEEAHERLMRLYAAQGKLSQARRQYHTLCDLLQQALNLDPDPRLRRLYDNLEQIAHKHADAATDLTLAPRPDFPAPLEAPPPKADVLPHLPLRLTSFFGRQGEIKQLHAWLNDPRLRLITLTGMGGAGKTRLALEVAKQPSRFGCDVTFVSLADTLEADLLLPTILSTLGAPPLILSDPLTRLAAVLGDRSHLLLLDNFEQIVDTAADTVLSLLEQIPNVVCLITSRQALNLPGEQELALTPLPVPELDLLPHELIANPTVQLLVDRMRVRRPDFQVTQANVETVAGLCVQLEGIPLAVELAAGWARDLTVSQMRDRLTHRFELLVSRQRGVPERHRSLRAAVESSYHLLMPSLQKFFLRLSVFRGGWREEMAEIACEPDDTGEGRESERLRMLREHSLITAQEVGERMRFGMLETLRAFGQEMLSAEERQEQEARHANWLLEFALKAAEHLRGPEQIRWLDRLEEEQENLRGALAYGMAHDPQQGLLLANALYWFWYVRGYYREGGQWLTALLERTLDAPPSIRAWGLLAAGHFANCQSNNPLAMAHYRAALALFEQTGDAAGEAHVLCRLGNAAQEMLDIETASRLCSESVARFRSLDDPQGLVLALFYYANTLTAVDVNDRVEECLALNQEALGIAENLGDIRFQCLLQHCLCYFHRLFGNVSAAFEGYRRALELQRVLRDPLILSYMLRELASLLGTNGCPAQAVQFYGAMIGLRHRLGYPVALHEQRLLQDLESLLHAGLTETDYRQAFEAGQTLDFEHSLHLARETIATC